MKQQIGVIGLAVMGKNLALNIAENGYKVAVYNRTTAKTQEMLEEIEKESLAEHVKGTETIEEFVNSLELPRKIILMVKAGDAVDNTINQLIPLLSEGDLIMDGGNSYYEDTIKRSSELEEKGFLYLGTGISGGEEGARNGPAIMPGGSKKAYGLMEEVLTVISAKVDGEPCCAYMGNNGAGHFVKMVHNGIEYADMQLICESYHIMKELIGFDPQDLKNIFTEWNKGELNSYLIDITAQIFGKKDTDTDDYIVNRVLDVAGQKGTGKWTGQISLDLGVSTPSITAAVYERYISSIKEERVKASEKLKGPQAGIKKEPEFAESVRKALYASKICAYAQGFALMKAASDQFGWNLSYADIAKTFRGGCIIRAQFLNQIKDAYEKNNNTDNLLMEDYFADTINEYQNAWREVICAAVTEGVSVPAFSGSLAYYDSYRTKNLPMNLLQAQRDFFGAHTYRRTDKEGIYHTNW